MRLQVLDTGHRPLNRLFLALVRRSIGGELPDPLALSHHRPEFFGAPFGDLVQGALRGPSPWTVGERELFAALVSKLNSCPF